MHSMVEKISGLLRASSLLLLVSLLLSACVTTERGGVGTKADEAKALDYSLQLARTYIRDKNWEAAKRHLKNAMEIDDRSAEIYEAQALVFQNTGEIDLAEENYRKALRLDDSSSRLKNNFAAYLYSQGEYVEAADLLEDVVTDTLYRNRGAALFNLGRCYRQLEKWTEAEQNFKRAHLLDRSSLPIMYELANTYYHLDDYPKAQRLYDNYRSRVKRQPPRGLLLGIRLADKFGNKNAVSSFALALKNLYPTSQEYLTYQKEFGGG